MIVNISSYKFTPLTDLIKLKTRLLQHCLAIELKGTILISPEGININLAGTEEQIEKFKSFLAKTPQFADMIFKVSLSKEKPFSRMLVKIKNEIITMGIQDIAVDEQENKPHSISAQELKAWLDENKDFILLDTRNDYETMIGSFDKAELLPIENFREFPNMITSKKEELNQKPVVMFCTGGVRCEKALPYLQQQGLDNIYQLEGGILKYFEECGGEHYQGECFVFDDRVAVDANLAETDTVLCRHCHKPVTKEQQQLEAYVENVSCPECCG